MRARLFIILGIVVVTGCTRKVRSGRLIDQYKLADCIPPNIGPGISPPTRSWNDVLRTADGNAIRVAGVQMPGGRIEVEYLSTGKEVVAANAGDYIYPADVRFDRSTSRLYVKASGSPAAFGGPQTWLFEYDLQKQHRSGRARVDPTVLPQECPASGGNGSPPGS